MTVEIDKRESQGQAMPSIWSKQGLISGANWIACADAAVQAEFLDDLSAGS